MPIWSSDHWTLLVVDAALQECRFYDSLHTPMESCWIFADSLLTELKKLPEMQWLPQACPKRQNHCEQGPLECGFFTCWWMEEEVRRACGERPFCRGYPKILGPGGQRELLCSVFETLEKANQKMQDEQKMLADADAAAEKAFNDKAAADAASLGVAFKTLEQQATEAMLKKDVGVPIVFDVEKEGGLEFWAEQMLEQHLLFAAHEADALRVKDKGAGVCSSCRFSAGCFRCFWPKTVRYWKNKQIVVN